MITFRHNRSSGIFLIGGRVFQSPRRRTLLPLMWEGPEYGFDASRLSENHGLLACSSVQGRDENHSRLSRAYTPVIKHVYFNCPSAEWFSSLSELKNRLGGQCFQTNLTSLAETFFDKGTENLFHWLYKCLSLHGNYLEK